MSRMRDDEFFMKRALRLARRGAGYVSPNPMVGCVIVKDGRIIGEGWHACCGEPHAEIEAITKAHEPIRGATVYVTLEPCAHYGRTPPCAERLVRERPARVVIGTIDPNPEVSGQGIALLRKEGIAVTTGIMGDACRELNAPFFKYITTGIPFVTVKYAQSLDGKIATVSGHARWISSLPSLRFAHTLRHQHDAILVGVGTVLADDPELTTRLVRGRHPLRVVVDSSLRSPATAKVFTRQEEVRTLLITSTRAPEEKIQAFRVQGVDVETVAEIAPGYLDFKAVLALLGKRQVTSLLVEGGSGVITTFVKESLIDRLIVVLSPCIIGAGKAAVGDLGVVTVEDAKMFLLRRIMRRGRDCILDLRPK